MGPRMEMASPSQACILHSKEAGIEIITLPVFICLYQF
jgi:hypothetical protein